MLACKPNQNYVGPTNVLFTENCLCEPYIKLYLSRAQSSPFVQFLPITPQATVKSISLYEQNLLLRKLFHLEDSHRFINVLI